MVNDAEKFKEEDEAQKDRIAGKNELESYAFQMKQTVEDDKVKDKITDEERKQIAEACDEAIKWLDGNQTVEKVCTPIITKMYQGAGGGMPGGMPDMGGAAAGGDSAGGAAAGGPTIEEVD